MYLSYYNQHECYLCLSLIRTRPEPLFEATICLQQPDLYSWNQQMPLVSTECHTLKIRLFFHLSNCKDGQAMSNCHQNHLGPTLQCSLASNLGFWERFCSLHLKYLIGKVLYTWFLKTRDLSGEAAGRGVGGGTRQHLEIILALIPAIKSFSWTEHTSSDKTWQQGRRVPNGFTLPIFTTMLWKQDYNSFFLRECLKHSLRKIRWTSRLSLQGAVTMNYFWNLLTYRKM